MQLGWVFALLVTAGGQSEPDCRAERPIAPASVAVDGGFTVTVESVSNAAEFQCRVEVRDLAGRVWVQREGFNTAIHSSSGRDVDNDGRRDVIVGFDTGGGNRCCWRYAVVSLSPTPHVIAELSNFALGTDGEGRTVIWTTHAFYDLGPSMAESPTILTAEQFRGGRLQEITLEHCDALVTGRLTGPADLRPELELLSEAHRTASRAARGQGSHQTSQTRVAALTVALQLQYCRRGNAARALVDSAWPAADRPRVRRQIREAMVRPVR